MDRAEIEKEVVETLKKRLVLTIGTKSREGVGFFYTNLEVQILLRRDDGSLEEISSDSCEIFTD